MGPVETIGIHLKVGEVLEKGENRMLDRVPEAAVETGAETVRTGASIWVHLEEGILNLLREEGIIEESELSDVVRIELVEIKMPNRSFGDPEKILEKGMEEGGLMIMGIEFNPIVFEDGDFVFPIALRGRHVEEFGVFVPLDDRFDFTSLFPKQHFLSDSPLERVNDNQPERFFGARQTSRLL